MDVPIFIHSQLLATKFFMPASPHPLISRPRLADLLQKSLKYPLTLISAPAGFGKTMLLSAWGKILPAGGLHPSLYRRRASDGCSTRETTKRTLQRWINSLSRHTAHSLC
jgi:hypothetical protein